MLKCAASLWSADMANFESAIKRVDPFVDAYHLDVADGHFTPTLLFFPDLVNALRPHTRRPFEVHLMATDPLMWIEPFIEAGVDAFIFCHDSLEDVAQAIQAVKTQHKRVGISLRIEEPVNLLDPFWIDLNLVTILATAVGIKGASMDPSIPEKIRTARQHIKRAGTHVDIECDGGIRRHTVPLMHEAGADWIVPGSLIFDEDPAQIKKWLASLGSAG